MNYRATSTVVPTVAACRFVGILAALCVARLALSCTISARAAGLSEQADLIAPRVFLIGHPKAGTGTGFLISSEHRLLATNAHVADMIHKTGVLYAMQNNSSHVFKIDKAWFHPGVLRETEKGTHVQSQDPGDGEVHPICPDVAVCHVAGDDELPEAVRLASWDEITSAVAEPIGMLGFPAHDTTDWPGLGEEAKATYRQGVVARVTDFKHNAGTDDAELQFVQHTMTSWFGFSGSPIFLGNGHVVGVNNSSREQEEQGMSTQIMYGIRIDCLWELLAYHKLTDKLPVPIAITDLRLDRFEAPSVPVSAAGAGSGGGSRPSGPPLAIAPFNDARAKELQDAWAKRLGVPVVKTNSIGMKFVLIPPGRFMMGYPGKERAEEIAEPFYIGAHEVTVGQYRRFAEETGRKTAFTKLDREVAAVNCQLFGDWFSPLDWGQRGFFKQTDECPVTHISWVEAAAFCVWLSRVEKQDYYLPKEAQWEFACRAGTSSLWYHGDDPRKLAKFANVSDISRAEKISDTPAPICAADGYIYTSPVGQFQANAFGIHDMHGNVREWCADKAEKSDRRLLRGGSYRESASGNRSAIGGYDWNNRKPCVYGFRVACEP